MKKLSATNLYALVFGFFLGLCIWKFGNPVILDQKIAVPVSPSEFIGNMWPTRWAKWILLPLVGAGFALAFSSNSKLLQKECEGSTEFKAGLRAGGKLPPWFWLLPLAWIGWQLLSAKKTVDADLTVATLWQFSGCVICYFIGAFLFRTRPALNFLLAGILAVFTFCLVRAVDQRLFEFPLNHQMLADGERNQWTNFPPEAVAEMKLENLIITTNGMDMANPIILTKFEKGRVNGTLVYPNALAGIILLLLPVSLALAFFTTKNLRRPIRVAFIGLAIFLGGSAFFWTGSKLGWLIGIGMAGFFLLRLGWSKKIKFAAVTAIFIFGLGIFTVRFHNYFSAGATSVGARFDYWRAAIQTTGENPLLGTGPGTFQRPYAQLKSPEAEMARLTHNDYLEQFSDSGIPGGLTYTAWVFLTFAVLIKTIWQQRDEIYFAVFAGTFGWFVQGFGEFGLYVPALAWIAFTLLGCLIGHGIIEFDKKTAAG